MALDWLQIAAPLFGGLLGGSSASKGETATAERKMDPRMDRLVYGSDGQSGLLGGAFNLLQNQQAQGGLNDLQRQGMDMQRQFLMSPEYGQSYNQMRNMGQSLMGAGVAGNPFTGGAQIQAPASQNLGGFQYSGLGNAQLPNYANRPALSLPETSMRPAGYQQASTYSPGSTRGSFEDSFASPWDSMSDAEKAAYYAANPTEGEIVRTLQDWFGSTSLGQLQRSMDPIRVENAQLIAEGYNPESLVNSPSFNTGLLTNPQQSTESSYQNPFAGAYSGEGYGNWG